MAKRSRKDIDDHTITTGTTNIFADLGFPNPEEHLLKASLVAKLHRLIEKESWTLAEAAKSMGIRQAALSRILRGRFQNYSVERLMRFLTKLGCTVDIVVKSNSRSKGKAETQTIHVGF